MKVTSLYICPWSLNDPLCQSQSLAYLRGLTEHDYKFALITFENPKYALNENEKAAVKKDLASQGIYWYPAAYHQGLSLFAKAFDNAAGFITGVKVIYKHRPRIIHSRSSLTVLLAIALAKVSGLKFLYDADSLLSEEYADIGHWSRESRGYRVMAKAEKLARKKASRIIVLTESLKKDYQDKFGVKTPIDVIPCCVDLRNFQFSPKAGQKKRKELNLSDEKLFIYVGKIGSWYLIKETFELFKEARKKINSVKLLIVSTDSPEAFKEIARDENVEDDSYFIVQADHSEVCDYLSAADVGIALIKMLESKRGSSPVKVAEYLAVGLPVIITGGIGDCSTLIKDNNVGAIIEKLDSEEYKAAVSKIVDLWTDQSIRARCSRVVAENISLDEGGINRYLDIYEKMLAENSQK